MRQQLSGLLSCGSCELRANFAQTDTVFVFNAGSQRMGCLYNFFVVQILPIGLTFSDFLGRLCECRIAMGKAHLLLDWPKLSWSHLWIDHMYFFARQWRTLSKFSCFAMEGSHRRLKRMLRNSGGLSLLRGRLGVHVVVENHIIDDCLRAEGWDITNRSMRGQGPVTVQ